MTDLNSITIIGRLTRDAEQPANGPVKISIAVNYSKKQGETYTEAANFFDVVIWGRTGEAIKQFLTKGKQVAIQGELRQDRWEHEGKPQSRVGILAHSVQLLASPQGSTQGQPDRESRQAAPASQPEARQRAPAADDGFVDDIPFDSGLPGNRRPQGAQ